MIMLERKKIEIKRKKRTTITDEGKRTKITDKGKTRA